MTGYRIIREHQDADGTRVLDEIELISVSKLMADDVCRVCYHVHPYGPCTETAEDPGPHGPVFSPCRCEKYVDLEAQSHIVVKKEEE